MASYYPSWCVDDRPPESLDFSKFDIVFYGAHTFYRKGFFKKHTHTHGLAFATPTSSGSLHWNDDSKMILQRLVACVRRSNCHTKIVLSIGKPSHGLYHAHV